ncbi:MAG: amino acid permease [Candidatus Heimdallarchaeota archaeon]|nr:amino acid permease [Candidatus Heimdallarchaeota archaeon]
MDSHSEFAKELGLKEAISIAIGAMIGGGIFSVLGRLSHIAGPAAVVSFGLGGIIVFLTANSYYKLIGKYPSAGGEFTILRSGFKNPLIGNITGSMLWLGYSVTIALYAFTFGLYTSEFVYSMTLIEFFDVHHTGIITGRKLFAFLSIFTFMLINLKGVKESGNIQNIIVLFKLSVLLFIGVLGVIYFKGYRYVPFTLQHDPLELLEKDIFGGFSGIVIGSAVIFVSYEGFQVIANTVEELKNPARDVKIGMYISVVTVAITYMVVTVATFSLVDDPTDISEAALIQAVEFLGPWAVLLITLGAAASTTSAINATLLGSSRLAYVMGDYSAFPKQLAVISKKSKVPYMAIITTSTISWFFTFVGNAEQIAEVGSIIFLAIFLIINISVIKIFPKEKNPMAKVASILIIFYILLVFAYFFTHLDESLLALRVLVIFTLVSFGYMLVNQRVMKDKDIDVDKYKLAPLGEELISEFKEFNIGADMFFIEFDRMLLPASGEKFETTNWELSAQIARKYNVEVDLLYIGSDISKISNVKTIFEKYGVKYNVVQKKRKNGKQIADLIIETYEEGNYQLISLSSRRTKNLVDRLFSTSVSRKVVNNVKSAVLQVHPPKYRQRQSDIANMFILLDGSERDFYLTRFASIFASVGQEGSSVAYHVVEVPLIMPLDDVAGLPVIQRSARNFSLYAERITMRSGLDAEARLLYGHNKVSSIKSAVNEHEPDAILIGHSKDKGVWNSIRTRFAYKLMNEIEPAVIIYHAPENGEQLIAE